MERPRGSDTELDKIVQTLEAMQLAEETRDIAVFLKSNKVASTHDEEELLGQAQDFIGRMRKGAEKKQGVGLTATGELSSPEELDRYTQALERLRGGKQTVEDGAVLGMCGDLFQVFHRVFLLSAYVSATSLPVQTYYQIARLTSKA